MHSSFRAVLPLLLAALGLAAPAPATSAEELRYRVVAGSLSDLETGERRELVGELVLERVGSGVPGEAGDHFAIPHFALATPDELFLPNPPIEYEGLSPILFLEIADQLNLSGSGPGLFALRAGGEIEVLGPDTVVARFVELRGGAEVIAWEEDGTAPARFRAGGTVSEIDQVFRVDDEPCRLPVPPPSPGGGGLVPGGTVEWERLEIDPGESVAFQGAGASPALSRVVVGGDVELFCEGLRPVVPPDEYPTDGFELVAVALARVAIDIQPWDPRNRIRRGRSFVRVAVLGSEGFDTDAVDPRSLRLGPAGAAPYERGGRVFARRKDVDRDGHPDLIVRFRSRDVGISPELDRLCLAGDTFEGGALEGCDAADPQPPRRRWLPNRWVPRYW